VEEKFMQTATQAAPVSNKRLWAGRIISALPVVLMVFGGAFGVLKPDVVVPGFAHFGYPERLLLPICIVEIACAIVYAIPRTSVLGAILLTGYLGGATATHVRIGDPLFFIPVILGVLVWGGLFLRDDRLRALIPLRT
jgi:DoxX-like family